MQFWIIKSSYKKTVTFMYLLQDEYGYVFPIAIKSQVIVAELYWLPL